MKSDKNSRQLRGVARRVDHGKPRPRHGHKAGLDRPKGLKEVVWQALVPPAAPVQPPLLEYVGMITIPALTGPFVARKKFISNYGSAAKPGVRIAYVSTELLDVIEDSQAETVISYAQLTRQELDGPILTSLGNRPDLAVLLRQIYWLMEQQPNGESGTLLNNGRANIFYRPGLKRVVDVDWVAARGGWSVYLSGDGDPCRWGAGRRVFSSNS